jgi:SAM-dependent methyltransferase
MRAFIDLAGGPELFSGYRLLRLSLDQVVSDDWFASAETSIFEGMNSIDIQAIDRGDGAYDVIVCSHVLEHVKDDDAALRELVRILSVEGFLLLAVPHTDNGQETDDWGFADPSRNLHFRGYGGDFPEKLASIAKHCHVFAIRSADPVTGDRKRFYLVTKSEAWRDRTLKSGLTE